MAHTVTTDVYGDRLEVYWDGNIWISPVNGQQHSYRNDAMRTELESYFCTCGEDPDSEDISDQIESLLADLVD